MKAKDSQVRYSEEFKRMVVSEIESGVMTANRAAKHQPAFLASTAG